MTSVEGTGVHGLLAWVCDLHRLNSVLASAPEPGAVPQPPAGPAPTADIPDWATRFWPQLGPAVTAPPEMGST